MILISIAPFTFKRFLLVLLALVGFAATSCFGDSILLSVRSTPYDNQMARIRPYLTAEEHPDHHGVSLALVNHWIGDLRSIPYGFTREWKTPSETESSGFADCKAKAVALYERMQEHGATNLRLVIGRYTASSRSTHAWLEWQAPNGNFVLDPTMNWMAYRVSDIGRDSYIPLYAFAGQRKFRVAPDTLVAQN